MLYYLFQILFFSLTVGIIAAVYHSVLAKSPVLNWWFRFGNRFEKKWFFDPVWGCVKCIAGQMALWGFLFCRSLAAWEGQGDLFTPLPYNSAPGLVMSLFCLIAAICGAIIFAMILARVITLLENN